MEMNFRDLRKDKFGVQWTLCLTCNQILLRLDRERCVHCGTEFTKEEEVSHVEESDCTGLSHGGNTSSLSEN